MRFWNYFISFFTKNSAYFNSYQIPFDKFRFVHSFDHGSLFGDHSGRGKLLKRCSGHEGFSDGGTDRGFEVSDASVRKRNGRDLMGLDFGGSLGVVQDQVAFVIVPSFGGRTSANGETLSLSIRYLQGGGKNCG